MTNPLAIWGVVRGRHADEQTVARRASARLVRLVRHAAARVPYYRDLFARAGLAPESIRGLEDLERIPLTSREDLQPLPISARVAEGVPERTLKELSTSGSSGRPLLIKVSAGDEEINQALLLRTLIHYGMKPWHSKMSMVGKDKLPVDDSWHAKLGLYRRLYISARWPPDRWVTELERTRPDYILGYCLTLRLMARALRERGVDGVRPRGILTTAGVLDEGAREEIQQAFGCPVVDLYASWEGGIMAWECRACGGYHVNADWVIVEILKDGRPAGPGEEGEVVITNLHSMGMPFIRYRQNDIAARHPGAPACGCGLPLIRSIWGRTADMIVLPSGRMASPHAFMVALDRTPGLAKWRLVQVEKARFRVETVPGPELNAEAEESVRKELYNLVGRPVQVDIVRVDHLPAGEGGKYRPVVCEVNSP